MLQGTEPGCAQLCVEPAQEKHGLETKAELSQVLVTY